ncbi:hypothetical protein [Clostridium botulinum]|uniref:hypothetical protein n=1 Tax=Clostridium botulinum TaxID=1491 RepID=UPI0019676F04|nr:hypothetical protein [Clostridium botulinum]MBN1078304.1 hypothetical protein [Clostridium botulinum]NFG60238.1 hypothetical protein [Clostridium botulinum]
MKNIKYYINKLRDKYWKYILLILIIVLIGVFFKENVYKVIPKDNKENFFTTILATLIGGIISIALTLIITNRQNKQKAIFERKENIYLPLYNEMKRLKKDMAKSSLDYNFKNEVIIRILSGYEKNITSKRVITLLQKYIEEVKVYLKLDYKKIAIDIIKNNFISGFKELYGSEIDGYEKVRDYEGNAELIEQYCEEIEKIRLIKEEDIIELISLLGTQKPKEIYNRYLIELYDYFINNDRKTVIKLPEPKYAEYGEEASKGNYIVEKYDFLDVFNKNEQIVKKYESRERINKIIDECIGELEYILTNIYNKYEKDIY